MAEATQTNSTPVKVSSMGRFAMGVQKFLLRHNLVGPMGDFVMVITVTGRKSGRSYSTPIAYLYDGDTIVALNGGGNSQWFRNVLVNPDVLLEIKGEKINARGEPITDPDEIARIFELYRANPQGFERLFGVPVDAPESDLIAARDLRHYIRFTPVE